MRSNQSNMPDDMLAKYLLGEASGAERAEVEKWLNQDERNKKTFEDFKLIWNESGMLASASNVNADDAWQRFKKRTQQPIPQPKSFMLLKAAAICLLLAGGSWLGYIAVQHNKQPVPENEVAQQANILTKANDIAENKQNSPALNERELIANSEKKLGKELAQNNKQEAKKEEHVNKKTLAAGIAANARKEHNINGLYNYYKKKGVVCNGTACPIEICIVQSAKCKNKETSKISTCSTLEPDESGLLHYNTFDKTLASCTLSIEEIRITRLSTGETIVLNDSTPVTAQNLFNYITGKKKGDIVAGMFHTDCNNSNHTHDLTFDNKLGDLLLK